MNNVSMIGNLTRDPELRSAKGGAVCQLRVAVDNPGRNGAKGEPTVSARLVFREWEGTAQTF